MLWTPNSEHFEVNSDLIRRVAAEAVGTAMLLAAVVGSGIMGERLAGGNLAITLLANSIATGTALAALIVAFGKTSGAHFNPVITLVEAWQGSLETRVVPAYLVSQIIGAFAGVGIAHLMFGQPLFSLSNHTRSGSGQLIGEFVATFGLVGVIQGASKFCSTLAPMGVGAYIAAAYWFTSSTSFANPAVTFARAVTNTFAGIRPKDVGGFIVVQLVAAFCAAVFFRWLHPSPFPRQRQFPETTSK